MGDFTRVKSPMNFHGGFYPSGNTLDYKMTHWLFTLFQIISNILTSSLLTFSVIYTFYFYIASEGLKIYQKYLIKKVPDFHFLEKFIRDNLNNYLRNSFLEGLSNFSLLLLLFDSSNLVSQATWRYELNQVIQTQAKILSLMEKNRSVVLNRFPFSEAKGSVFYFKKTYWLTESLSCAQRSPGSGPICTWHATPENGNCERKFKNAHTNRVFFFTVPALNLTAL